MRRVTACFLMMVWALAGCLDPMVQQRVSTLEAQIQQHPTDAAAHRELGQVWFDAGHDQKAVEHLSLAVKLDPADGDSFTTLGLAYARLEDYDNAVRVLKAGQRFGSAKNDFALGAALLGAGRQAEAVAALKQALKKDPSLGQVYRVAVGEADAETVARVMQENNARERALEQVMQDTYNDLKDQIRQQVREQVAEDLILRQ